MKLKISIKLAANELKTNRFDTERENGTVINKRGESQRSLIRVDGPIGQWRVPVRLDIIQRHFRSVAWVREFSPPPWPVRSISGRQSLDPSVQRHAGLGLVMSYQLNVAPHESQGSVRAGPGSLN